jgi:hypothetical protein
MAHRMSYIKPPHCVTEEEVNSMIKAAITQHNRNASLISMYLGMFFFAAFVDGVLRMIGKVPPFMGIDITI